MDKKHSLKELTQKSCAELMAMALREKLAHRGKAFALCGIVNAKSGQCSEDCHFCVQSAHFKTDAPVYPLLGKEQILQAARQAVEDGTEHFSIVTSGRGLMQKDLDKVVEIVAALREEVPVKICASLGILNKEDCERLKDAGLTRYHHNLETSREFFSKIVTTHSFEERVATIEAAQEAGLEVCAGGIFGLGESEEDRLSMAESLVELEVDSVPINVLIPLPGTPLENQIPISAREVLRSIALYRLLMPGIPLRLAAGRETVLQDFLSSAYLAGADGMMIGGYLTKRGRAPEQDMNFVRQITGIWEELITK